MTSAPLEAELALLRECQDRVLEREGIPMVLSLVSEVGPMPVVTSADVRAEGSALADSMDRVRAAVLPTSRDDDMGCLISVLQSVSYVDFGREGRA
ncbi:hypothetical protein acdb102_30790 [Acidothermaceae bacterium B102]|nr:hypothetical protein acdb102_30790 [Acidothermaceae bacterium B102]